MRSSCRFFQTVNKVDLPLLPRIIHIHKEIKSAIQKYEHEVPLDIIHSLNDTLANIRRINWHKVNSNNCDYQNYSDSKKLMHELLSFKTRLPQKLLYELEHKCIFDQIIEVIETLHSRYNDFSNFI